MSVLLIWNCIEEMDYYLLPESVLEEEKFKNALETTDGCYINSCENSDEQDNLLLLVSNAVSTPSDYLPDLDPLWDSIWLDYKVELSQLKGVKISNVYECGWLL